MSTWIAAISAVITLGGYMTVIGWRGRVVPCEPACRSCRFGLSGLPPTCARCPECGSHLGSPGGIRTTKRRPRLAPIYAGAIVTLVGLCAAGIGLWGWATSYDWNRHKPTDWLISELRSGQAGNHAAAVELTRRVLANGAAGREAEIAEAAIVATGTSHAGDLIDALVTTGGVHENAAARYAVNRLQLDLDPPLRVHAGQPMEVPGVAKYSVYTSASQTFNELRATWSVFATFDGSTRSAMVAQDDRDHVRFQGDFGWGKTAQILSGPVPDLPGPSTIRLMARIELVNSAGDLLHTEDRTTQHAITIVPADEPLVRIERDENLHRDVQRTIHAAVSIKSDVATRGPFQYLEIRLAPPVDLPIPLAGSVEVFCLGQNETVGELAWSTGPGSANQEFTGFVILPDDGDVPQTVTISVRPSGKLAAAMGFERMLGDLVEIGDCDVMPR